MDIEFITASEAARVLHSDPQDIRLQAHKDPRKLGFPVVVIGQAIKIPKKPFYKYLLGEDLNNED